MLTTSTDPSLVLPEELLAQIMSYLDAPSLMQAEAVSHRWCKTASSYHAWRHVFWKEYSLPHTSNLGGIPVSQVGGLGFGKARPDQDWKQMWKVRQMLQARWSDAHAAAIYLEGHRDSVYCVQFDECVLLCLTQ